VIVGVEFMSHTADGGPDDGRDALIQQLLRLLREAEANGIDSATLIHAAIQQRETQGAPPLVPILDQLVQKAAWMKAACSG
jgi:hypothetical protein